ncbi:unnamed protein product [Meganyctiphanes norvegica]|uniref:Uncharacterized protein n=1 Tax=Meganyctiphanes norvegica TaxID=48144 RepID=A0AAV2R5U1_MEGNR
MASFIGISRLFIRNFNSNSARKFHILSSFDHKKAFLRKIAEVCTSQSYSALRHLQSQKYIEEETMTYKIIKHIRSDPNFASQNDIRLVKLDGNYLDTTHAVQQKLLVIAHSPNVKPDEILNLFALYTISKKSIMQDVINDQQLMTAVRMKIRNMLTEMDIEQLASFSTYLKQLRSQSVRYIMSIASDIARECERRALESPLPQTLELFDILMILYGNNVFRKKPYETFSSIFESYIDSAPPHHLVQISHYIGLGKRKKIVNIRESEMIDNLVDRLEKEFESLSFIDAGIAISGLFKVNAKFKPDNIFLEKVVECLKARAESGEGWKEHSLESYCFVSMLKLLRSSKYHENKKFEDLIPALKKFVLKLDDMALSPQGLSHLIAIFSTSNIYDKKLFEKLVSIAAEHIKSFSIGQNDMRLKDLSKFLYSMSHTGHTYSKEFLMACEGALWESLHNGDAAKHPYYLCDALLSMAISGHFNKSLLQEAFNPSFVHSELRAHQRSKRLARLQILYEYLKYELPDFKVQPPNISETDVPKRSIREEVHYRPVLAQISDAIAWFNEQIGIKLIFLKFPVPFINYASVVLDLNDVDNLLENFDGLGNNGHHILNQLSNVKENTQRNFINLEILDPHTGINNCKWPTGLVKLKMKILEHRGWGIVRLRESECTRLGDDHSLLAAMILDKLCKVDQ